MKDFFTHQDLFTCQNTADFHSAVEGSSINGIRLVPFENLVSSLSLMFLIIDQTSVQRRVVFDSSGQSCIGSPSSAASTTVGKMSTNSTLLMQKMMMMMMIMTMRKSGTSATSMMVMQTILSHSRWHSWWQWWWWRWLWSRRDHFVTSCSTLRPPSVRPGTWKRRGAWFATWWLGFLPATSCPCGFSNFYLHLCCIFVKHWKFKNKNLTSKFVCFHSTT